MTAMAAHPPLLVPIHPDLLAARRVVASEAPRPDWR